MQMNLIEAPIDVNLALEQVKDSTLEIKLMELGFTYRSSIRVIRKAPFSGPLTLQNHKAQIILRKEDAQLVEVTPL